MFTLFISANVHNTKPFGLLAVIRLSTLMDKLTELQQKEIDVVVGSYKGVKELSVRVQNCTLSVNQIKHIMRTFSQESALIVWEKPGVAELISTGEYSQSLALEFQKTYVLPESATFIISEGTVMVAK